MKNPLQTPRRFLASGFAGPLFAIALTSAFLEAGPGSAFGSPATWSGGGANNLWSNGSNWEGGVAPVSGTDTVIILSGSSNRSPSVSSGFNVNSLTFDSDAGAFSLSGSPLRFYGLNADTEPGLANRSSQTQTINNNVVFLASRARAIGGDMIFNGTVGSYNNPSAPPISGVRFSATGGYSITVNGVITSDNQYSKVGINGDGSGNVYFNAVNTYTSPTAIYNDNLVINHDALPGAAGALGNSSTAVALGGAGSNAGLLTAAAIEVGRDIQAVSGSTVLTLGGGTADTSLFSGTITLGSNSNAAQEINLTAAAGGRVNITGSLVRAAGATGSGDAVTKIGAGIVVIAGSTNTYGGMTTVSEGALLVNGALGSGAAVSVAPGATLGGKGTIPRDVSVDDGGILSAGDMDAAGNSLGGTLSLNHLSLANASLLDFDLGAPGALDNDHLSITGNLVLDGVLNVNPLEGFTEGVYELFSYTGTLTDHGLTLGSLNPDFTYSFDTGTTGVVNLLVVPEPGPLGLMLSAGAFGLCACCLRNRESRKSRA